MTEPIAHGQEVVAVSLNVGHHTAPGITHLTQDVSWELRLWSWNEHIGKWTDEGRSASAIPRHQPDVGAGWTWAGPTPAEAATITDAALRFAPGALVTWGDPQSRRDGTPLPLTPLTNSSVDVRSSS